MLANMFVNLNIFWTYQNGLDCMSSNDNITKIEIYMYVLYMYSNTKSLDIA